MAYYGGKVSATGSTWKTGGGGFGRIGRVLMNEYVQRSRAIDDTLQQPATATQGTPANIGGDHDFTDPGQSRIDRKNKQLSWFGFGFGLFSSMAISGALKGAVTRLAVGTALATAAYYARTTAVEMHGHSGAFFGGFATGSIVGSLASGVIEGVYQLAKSEAVLEAVQWTASPGGVWMHQSAGAAWRGLNLLLGR